MKSFLVFIFTITLSVNSIKAQEYKMMGNATDCSRSFEESIPSVSCSKFLYEENGSLKYSEIPEGSENAQWEFIDESPVNNGNEEDEYTERYSFIKNRQSGKYLAAVNGVPQCIDTDRNNPAAMWSYIETDVATFEYVFLNKLDNEILVLDNGSPKLTGKDQYSVSFNKRENQWSIILFGNTIAPGDPLNIDPPASVKLSSEYQEILDRNNYWRSQLGIAPLVWSDELSASAQEWVNELSAKGCVLKHKGPGENLYMGSESGKDAVDLWASERKDFNYDTWADNWQKVGHYTQLIWENSKKVGCAKVKCSDGSYIWLCKYDPPGNYTSQKPYIKK
ncbi:MAG TPA: CAP domain-containing protein [Ignavibacteria bacterium]|nr:CAP domain-containing protein [Ignavibacteria bacterium]HMR41903.1 CAP domain-containing protein [Ignavibacteria bacterium]